MKIQGQTPIGRALLALIVVSLAACAPARHESHDSTVAEQENLEVLEDGPEGVEGDEAPSEENILAHEEEIRREFPDAEPQYDDETKAEILSDFGHLDPKGLVPRRLLEQAVLYFQANKSKFDNQNYIVVIDYGKRSTDDRFFVVNMKTGSVDAHHTSHGSGSDKNKDGWAEKFSNTKGSKASSIGYARTAETYSGKHGRSLRIDGLSDSNSNLRRRAVVVHSAKYVKERSSIQGRSEGCPALALDVKDDVVSKIKGGALLFMADSR